MSESVEKAFEATKKTTGNISTYKKTPGTTNKLNVTMQLFGLPYQFLPSVDQRMPGVSDKIGRKYVDNIIMDSSIVTIIPGEPRYLPGVTDKTSWTNALISSANGNFDELKALTSSNNMDKVRLYDFQSAYMKYYQYVNILCRSAAGYLELEDKTGYKINNQTVNFLTYDWKNYRWNGNPYHSVVGKVTGSAWNSVLKAIMSAKNSVGKLITSHSQKVKMSDPDVLNKSNDELDVTENVLRQTNYIQFYCEAESIGGNESLSNSTQQSTFKQMLDQGSSAMKDIAFLTASGGVDTASLSQLGDAANDELQKILGGGSSTVNTTAGSIVSRLLSAGKSVIKGENMMMPDIWSGTDNNKQYQLTFKFKAMYGNRLSLYTDVIVPLMHVIALAYPRATSANTYSSPPLVKVYRKGAWTCNLGIVSGIEINKDDVPEAWNADGMSTEVTVTLTIADLYSDMALAPANDPLMFVNNSSLVEFLATTCGLDLVEPQLKTKVSNLWNTSKSFVKDIPKTAMGKVSENFDRIAAAFTGL